MNPSQIRIGNPAQIAPRFPAGSRGLLARQSFEGFPLLEPLADLLRLPPERFQRFLSLSSGGALRRLRLKHQLPQTIGFGNLEPVSIPVHVGLGFFLDTDPCCSENA